VQPSITTSAVLVKILGELPADHVNLAWLLNHLRVRSFGILLLILAIVSLVPGVASVSWFVLTIPAIEMILGREKPTLPRFVAERAISTERFARWVSRVIPLCRHMEKFIRPRLHTPFRATERLVGLIILILAVTLLAPFPFNVLPAFAIILISVAYLQEDGLLLCVSFIAALMSISFTGGIVWAMIEATGLVQKHWLVF
jgi:hypothetical protein